MSPLDEAIARHVSLLSLLPTLGQAFVLGVSAAAAWRICVWVHRLPGDKREEW